MRKFVQSVGMPCSWQQYSSSLHEELQKFSIATLDLEIQGMKYVFFNRLGLVTWDYKPTAQPEYYTLTEFNPELFLAIAAMTSGSKFNCGEYVKIGQNKSLLKVVDSAPANQLKLSDRDDGYFLIPVDYLSKASLEEVVASFSSIMEPTKGWQPIETAPKDKQILLLNSGGIGVGRWNDAPDGHKPGFQGVVCGWNAWCGHEEYDLMVDNPTHWMPLPELPKP